MAAARRLLSTSGLRSTVSSWSRRGFFGGGPPVQWSLVGDAQLTQAAVSPSAKLTLYQAFTDLEDHDPSASTESVTSSLRSALGEALAATRGETKPGRLGQLASAFAALARDSEGRQRLAAFRPQDALDPQLLHLELVGEGRGELFAVLLSLHRLPAPKEQRKRRRGPPKDELPEFSFANAFEVGGEGDRKMSLYANLRLEKQLKPSLDKKWTLVAANFFY